MNSENLITRREFIETSGLAAAMLVHPSVYSATPETSGTRYSRRLVTGWEFHQGSPGGIWAEVDQRPSAAGETRGPGWA
jgi:hypothetical protein